MSFVTFIFKQENNPSSLQRTKMKLPDGNASRSQCVQDYNQIIGQIFDIWHMCKGVMVDSETSFSCVILPEHDGTAIHFKDFRKRNSILRLATELANLDDEINIGVSISVSDAAAPLEDRYVLSSTFHALAFFPFLLHIHAFCSSGQPR